MGTSNISSIGKALVQGQSEGVQNVTREEELQVAFCEVISQMSVMVGNDFTSGKQMMDSSSGNLKTSTVADTDYDRYGKCSVKIQESSGKKVEQENLSEKMDKFADDVKEVLKEELGISEEQIEEAMETLGLSFFDLLNPNQLASLVAELTGSDDMSALLCSEEFMTIMQELGELGANLLQELGISSEELAEMLVTMEDTDSAELGKQMLHEETMLNASENHRAEAVEQPKELADAAETEKSTESLDGKFAVNEKVQDAKPEGEQENHAEASNIIESDEDISQNETAPDKQNSGNMNKAFTGNSSENAGVQTGNDVVGSTDGSISQTAYAEVQNSAGTVSSQVDVANIIRQIVEYSRVTLSASTTTMEMQLNPENLGKIYMEVTAKNGMVSAHITAQNEAVKEALESQMVEFRQNLNQAGIKVEAVEVTVGSHEFEKNLEQNAKQQEHQAEEQEKAAKQTRRINLSDLDELSAPMTEEENLVAQMMADQGNSIDYTA